MRPLKASSSWASRTRIDERSFSTRSRTAVLMRKPSPLWARGTSSVALQDHQHAALRVDRLDGQVQDHGEEFVERPVLGELLTGADQRLHGRRRVGAAALDGHGLVGERARQAGDYGGGGGRTGLAFEDDHPGSRARLVGREHDHQVAGGHAVAGLENQSRLEGNVVDEGAVLAAQVLHRPIVAFRFEREVLAGEAGIFGKAKLGGAGTADRQARPGEWNGLHLPIRTLDDKFTRHGSFLGIGDKHSL